MYVVTDILPLGDQIYNFRAQVFGMRGSKPYSLDPFYLRDSFQEMEEPPAVPVMVGIDVLAQKGDFHNPIIDQFLSLSQNFLKRSAAFPASDVRDDAIATKIIATGHNG